MADNDYSTDIYKYANNIGTVMRNPEIWQIVPDHLKTGKMCKHAVKNYLF